MNNETDMTFRCNHHTLGLVLVKFDFRNKDHEFNPILLWRSCYSIFSFLSSILQIIVYPFVCFLLTIALSVHNLIRASDYPFGIFRLFL